MLRRAALLPALALAGDAVTSHDAPDDIHVDKGTTIEVTVDNSQEGSPSSKTSTSQLNQKNSADQMPLAENVRRSAPDATPPAVEKAPEKKEVTPEAEPFWRRFISFAFLLKLAAILSNVITQLSPLRIIAEIRQQKTTGVQDGLPYFMIAVCGTQWCFYGLFAWWVTGNQGFVIVVYANVLGVLLGAFYTYTFQKFCIDPTRASSLKLYFASAMILYVFQTTVLCIFRPEKALLITGCVAAVMSVLVTASPLFDLHTVLETKSTKCWPSDLIIASFISNSLWICCGIMLYDFWILFPNIIGLVTGGGQLYILYKFAGSEEEERPLLRATRKEPKWDSVAATSKALTKASAWTGTSDEEMPEPRPMPTCKEESTASTHMPMADGTGGT